MSDLIEYGRDDPVNGDPTNPGPGDQESKTEAICTDHVCELALTLFDHTESLHELGSESKRILAAAAKLYDQAKIKFKKKPILSAKKLIRGSLKPKEFRQQFSDEDVELLAVIVALQHGAVSRKQVSKIGLDSMREREALTLAAILNIAVGLDASESHLTVIEEIESFRDGVRIVVSGPHAPEDAAAAQNNSRLWERIGYPQIRVLEASRARKYSLPFPTAMERPGIEPTDSLAEAGRKVMLYQFAAVLQYEPGTRLGHDIEALHDMRVATRRLRAAFEVFGQAFEPKTLKPHLSGLRATGRALGQVRDLDVFIEKAEKFMAGLPAEEQPGMMKVIDNWRAQRETARSKMLEYLESQAYFEFKRKFNVFLNTTGAGVIPPPVDHVVPYMVRELAPALIYERLASVRAFDSIIPGAPIEQHHALRIEFKKLRYTVEYFRDVMGKQAGGIIDELKTLQDHLGDLNDATVASAMLKEYLAGLENLDASRESSEDRQAILHYLDFNQIETARLIETFPQAWDRFNRPELRKNLALAVSVL